MWVARCVGREVAVLHVLDHPNIVKMLQAFLACAERAATVLAFPAADTDLYAFLRRRGGRVSDLMAQDFSRQLAMALQHMHERSVVHRDLKPANVLVMFDLAGKATLQVADFSRARELPRPARYRMRTKTVVDNANFKLNACLQGLTPGVCTLVYCAPELLCCERDDRVEEAPGCYGAQVDIWSFGCIMFELLAADYFAWGVTDAGVLAACIRRLGEPAPKIDLGGRHMELFAAARHKVPQRHSVLPLQDVLTIGPAQAVVLATLQWAPTQRPEITKLLRVCPWLCTTLVVDEAALAMSQGQCGDLQQRARCVDLGNLQSLVPTTDNPCQCSGHCYTPGHNYRRGCGCNEVVQGSQYCIDCVCILPGCLKPRYHGKRCHKHGNLVKTLPLALRAVEACGAASMDLMRMDIVTFLEYHVVASQDLVFALVASMLNVPVALQILHEGIADLPGDGNYSGEQFGKVLEQIVARLSERGRAEEVDNWSGGGRLC